MYKIFIYSILLLDLSLFYLVPISGGLRMVIGDTTKIVIVGIGIVSIIIYYKKIFKNKKYLFLNSILFFMFIFICELILSKINYQQASNSIIRESHQYGVIICYFIICYFIEKENIEKLTKTLLTFTLIISSVLVVQFIIYEITNSFFLHIDIERTLSNMRFGSIRIYESTYFPIWGGVFSFGVLLNNKKNIKVLALITFIISLIEIVLVSKNRMGLIMLLISIIFMMLIKKNKHQIYKILLLFFMGFTLIIMFKLPVFNKFITSINLSDKSINTRVEAVEHYMQQVKTNPFFGAGFIEANDTGDSYYLVRGANGKFYLDDIGIIGIIYTFGIVGILWYTIMLLKIFRLLINIYMNKKQNNYIELYGLAMLIIGGSIFMNPFDPQRIVLFPFFLSLLDNAYKECTTTKIEN